MALTTKRIIALPSQSDPQEGDYLAIDNATNGTHKIPVGRIGVEVDDTLAEQGKAADAKAVGDALDEIRSQVEATDDSIDEIRSQIEVTGTASGAIATFSDGSTMPMKSCTAQIVPKQSGTGTPSPDNVRPISGWSSVDVNVAGGNLIDVSTNQSGAIDASGNEVANSTFNRTDFIPIDKANIYIKTSTATGYTMRVHGYSSSKAWVQQLKVITTSGTTLLVGETVPNNVAYVRISYPVIGVDNTELWQGDTTTVNLGRTVYGGTLDVVTGVLTVDKGFATFDGSSDETWFNNGSVGAYTPKASLPNVKPIWPGVTILSNQYMQVVSGQAPTVSGTFNWNDNMNALQFRNDNALSATDFRAALAQNPVTIVYPLTTPQTYTLTGQEVDTLLGDNNVWADSGDVEVVYIRDLNIAINNLLNSNGTRSLGMMAMSAPTEATAEEPTDEPAEDDMR